MVSRNSYKNWKIQNYDYNLKKTESQNCSGTESGEIWWISGNYQKLLQLSHDIQHILKINCCEQNPLIRKPAIFLTLEKINSQKSTNARVHRKEKLRKNSLNSASFATRKEFHVKTVMHISNVRCRFWDMYNQNSLYFLKYNLRFRNQIIAEISKL